MMRRTNPYRSGFTLLEMLLVLGVIALFVAMAVPSVLRMFHQQKLNESGESVRAAAASARVRAIESGLVYQFCIEPGGRRFVVVPFEPDHSNTGTGAPVSPASIVSRVAGQMHAGISFSSAMQSVPGSPSVSLSPQKISTVALEGLPNASDLANVSWSTPILFHPDGSANMDVEIAISDLRSQQIKLRVRLYRRGQHAASDTGASVMMVTREARSGLTLLEIVLSLALFFMATAALSQLAWNGSRAAIQARLRTQATIRCEAKLNEVLAGAAPMQTQSNTPFPDDSNWTWGLSVTPSSLPELMQIDLTVSHRGGGAAASVDITLRRWSRQQSLFAAAAEQEKVEAVEKAKPQ